MPLIILTSFAGTCKSGSRETIWNKSICLICSEKLVPEFARQKRHSIYLIDKKGTKLRVNVCKHDYYHDKFSQTDYDKMSDRIYEGERMRLIKAGKDPSKADYFKKMKFFSHKRRSLQTRRGR